MKPKHLCCFLVLVLFAQLVYAQQMRQPDPELRVRLQHYAVANHLYADGMYMYFDTVTKKPVMFSAKSFLILDYGVQRRLKNTIDQSYDYTANSEMISTSNFHLVKDVNTLTDASISNGDAMGATCSFVVLNNVSYFSADDGIHGKELWRSNGTAAGTYLVKDILGGDPSAAPFNMTVVGSKVFFVTYNSTQSGYLLWKTDGTATGTVQVKDFTGVAKSSSYTAVPYNLCNVNGMLYFTISSNQFWDQLWKSDGTTAGTSLVKDFNAVGGSYIRALVAMNGLVYFVGADANYGAEIWRSNGTASGTYMLKDINPQNDFFNGPSKLTSYNNKLYFAGSDGEIWMTDGTSAGTIPVPGYNGTSVDLSNYSNWLVNTPFTVSNHNLYFPGSWLFTGTELFKYDIDNAYYALVKDLHPGTDGISIMSGGITDVNGTVYFAFTDTAGAHLYKTEGTESTTIEIKHFRSAYNFGCLVNGNGKLYFTAADSSTNSEPWISDGTPAGTRKLKEIYSGTTGSGAYYFTACNNGVVFTATDNLHGEELWVSNGNSTQLVKQINKTTTSGSGDLPNRITTFKNGVLLSAATYAKGYELYTGNATDETLVKDIFPDQIGGSPRLITVKNNIAYFSANVPAVNPPNLSEGIFSTGGIYLNQAIFKTNGTAAGTVQITPSINGGIQGLTVTDNGTVFYILNRFDNDELWKTDGTAAGNEQLRAGIFFNYEFDEQGYSVVMKALGNTVYFSAVDYGTPYGSELWKSDGTVQGTVVVKDINAGTNNANPGQLTVFNNQLYFSANDGSETAIWKSNGTVPGTIKLKSVAPASFAVSNNKLFFNGNNSTRGAELWKTDGTKAGTVLVKDINIGTNSSNPVHLTDVNGTLFFSASDSTNKIQLWKSDGTKSGTRLVKNIIPAKDAASLAFFTSAANKLFFTVNNRLWTSDGTAKATGAVPDKMLDNLLAYNLTGNGNQLFFGGYNYQYGYELYAGDVSGGVQPLNTVPFTALLQSADVVTKWQTSAENNTAYFNVQRSTDGVHFNHAGKIVANGNSSQLKEYSFYDVNIANLTAAKTIYYRLETVDKDGKITLSKRVPINLNGKDFIMLLHPNPAKDVLNIRLNNYAGNAIVSIYDLTGKKLSTIQQNIQSGKTITINIASLQAGVYFVEANMNNTMVQQKFVKE